jgi:hypothetical protein
VKISDGANHVLNHMLGLTGSSRVSYRNHFVAGEGHHDMPQLEELEHVGFVKRGITPKFCGQGDIVFYATQAGQIHAIENLPPEPLKSARTRYDDYIESDFGGSFHEYLSIRKPQIEIRRNRSDIEYRMFRMARHSYGNRDVEGEWASTKKEAKVSYKNALRIFRERSNAS